MEKAEVIKTRAIKGGLSVTVKCPYCKHTHKHGASPSSTYPEHRVADCFKGSYHFQLRSASQSH